MMKNQFLSMSKPHLIKEYGDVLGEKVFLKSLDIFDKLITDNKDEPKAMHAHTRAKIYPCIALINAQIANGISPEKAIIFARKFIEFRSYKAAKFVKSIMKIPFIYKIMPVMFGKMTKRTFGVRQQFDAVFYEVSTREMRFDMTKCPYHDILEKYGYKEMTTAFCRGDDIVYGDMHKNLVWGRTKTLGDGDNCCNFKLTVVRK